MAHMVLHGPRGSPGLNMTLKLFFITMEPFCPIHTYSPVVSPKLTQVRKIRPKILKI